MNEFTVITWSNEKYNYLAKGLKNDCQRFGYNFKHYKVESDYQNLNAAWNMHPQIIKQGIEEFGKVLFLDCECRILKQLPNDLLSEPFISVRNPSQYFWIKYNSGTVYADQSCLGWIDIWINILAGWKLHTIPEDAYIYYPNDICDELALSAALLADGYKPKEVKLEYVDKKSDSPIARGYWENEHTLIQHPTLHHWPYSDDPHIAKKLFVQNFSQQDTNIYDQFFLTRNDVMELDGWRFDFKNNEYAPLAYQHHKRPWIFDKVFITAQER